jgi:hypothetical protein
MRWFGLILALLAGCASAGGGGSHDLATRDKGGGDGGGSDGGGAADLRAPPPDLAMAGPDLAATCSDGKKNGAESDVDCGGMACPKCADGKGCLFAADCESGMCNNNVCQPMVSCMDQIKNGAETDVDCGGPKCPPCLLGRGCAAGADCSSGNCSMFLCCAGGKGNCDGNAGNGCEADFATDAKNCGACGMAYPMNAPVCMGGACKAVAMQLVGSYTLGQGQNWTNNPPTYTCQEACAVLFGGQAANYGCSTSNGGVTHTAWVDCWGDSGHCSGQSPLAENYKKNTNYNCGQLDCACSAFVSDNCAAARNYCYK